MLLRSKIVHVPAREEIDADLSEYGFIGIKCKAAYGAAGVEAAAADFEQNDDQTNVVDALANIMHHCAYDKDLDFDGALDTARMHFEAELRGDDFHE